MKKTILTISALLMVCLAFYGWKPLLVRPSSPQMQTYFHESEVLGTMPADSASRFIVNFMGYTMLNPSPTSTITPHRIDILSPDSAK